MRIWKWMLVVTTTIWKVPSTFLFLSVFLFAYAAVVFETEAFMEFAHARGILTLPPANCTHKHEIVISRGRILSSCLILETGGKGKIGGRAKSGLQYAPKEGHPDPAHMRVGCFVLERWITWEKRDGTRTEWTAACDLALCSPIHGIFGTLPITSQCFFKSDVRIISVFR